MQYEMVSSNGTTFKQIAEEAEPFLPEQHDYCDRNIMQE